MPEKPSFLDKPEERKMTEEEKIEEGKRFDKTNRGEVVSEREKKDLQKRGWDEIK
jgi:hypothetical protein